jgi:hypothetical protein
MTPEDVATLEALAKRAETTGAALVPAEVLASLAASARAVLAQQEALHQQALSLNVTLDEALTTLRKCREREAAAVNAALDKASFAAYDACMRLDEAKRARFAVCSLKSKPDEAHVASY